jgi:hypothetical protein
MTRIVKKDAVGAEKLEKLGPRAVERVVIEVTIWMMAANENEGIADTRLMIPRMRTTRSLQSQKVALNMANGGAGTRDEKAIRTGHQKARPDPARPQHPTWAILTMSEGRLGDGRYGMMTTYPSFPLLCLMKKIAAPRKKRRNLRSRRITMTKNASIAEGSIVQIVVPRTAQTTMMHVPLFQALVVARREVVAVKKDTENGGTLMRRYIALPMCDSTVVRHVFRMNVDVVFIGSFKPPNPALACR